MNNIYEITSEDKKIWITTNSEESAKNISLKENIDNPQIEDKTSNFLSIGQFNTNHSVKSLKMILESKINAILAKGLDHNSSWIIVKKLD